MAALLFFRPRIPLKTQDTESHSSKKQEKTQIANIFVFSNAKKIEGNVPRTFPPHTGLRDIASVKPFV